MAYSGRVGKDKHGIYLVNADGTGLQALPGTDGAADPVFSPDGSTLAFSRTRIRQAPFDPKHPLESVLKGNYASTTAWLLDLATGGQQQLTPWRNDLHVEPSSFSPDGTLLALSSSDRGRGDAVALRLSDGRSTVIAHHAEQPVYSPDGSRIAFISYRDRNLAASEDEPALAGELYTIGSDGTNLRRLTHTRRWQESSPSWDPSGERLAYTQTTGAEFLAFGFTNVVMEINADGNCPIRVLGRKRTSRALGPGLYGPAWQPGPGREAGRIEC